MSKRRKIVDAAPPDRCPTADAPPAAAQPDALAAPPSPAPPVAALPVTASPPRRPGRPRRIWLTDARGGRYRLAPDAIGYQVLHQDREGRLWRQVVADSGAPLVTHPHVTRADLIALVGATAGVLQLIPVDARGRLTGQVPEMVTIDEVHTSRPAIQVVAVEVCGQDGGQARAGVRRQPRAPSPRRP